MKLEILTLENPLMYMPLLSFERIIDKDAELEFGFLLFNFSE